MKKSMLLTRARIENDALTPEASDEALIGTAKSLNEAVRGHLRRSVEDFWKMGEALSHLYQRRHNKGRWADILAEIGINRTTDNQARRLYRSTTVEGLAEYRNKTAALRALGILSSPSPTTAENEDREEPESIPDHSVKTHTTSFVDQQTDAVSDEADNDAQSGYESNTPTAGHRPTTAPVQDNSLEVLAQIAARLEILAEQAFVVTPDHMAQIDRAIEALDRLRAGSLVGTTA